MTAAVAENRLVTEESVWAACGTLVEQGRKPSFRTIIEVLGGGSPNDIQRHFSTWKAKQAEAAAGPTMPPEPPALPRIAEELPEVAALLEPLAAGLMKAVSGMLDRQKTEYEGRLATVQEGAELRVTQAKIDAEGEIKRGRTELAAETEEWQAAEGKLLEEKLTLTERVAELEAANGELVAAAEEAGAKAVEAEDCLALSRRSYDFCVIERDEARRKAAAEAEKAVRLEAETASLRSQVDTLHARNERLHDRIEAMAARLARKEADDEEEAATPGGP